MQLFKKSIENSIYKVFNDKKYKHEVSKCKNLYQGINTTNKIVSKIINKLNIGINIQKNSMIKKNKKKSVFITGGAGCIGLALINFLVKKNYVVKLFDLPDQIEVTKKLIDKKVKLVPGSILDKSAMINSIEESDIVVHLAASLGVRNTEENNYRCYQINVRGTENILDICLQKKIKKFIYASSSEVYGEPITNPITENFNTYPKSIYAQTKLMGEGLVKSYNQMDKNLKYIIFRFLILMVKIKLLNLFCQDL